MAVAGLRSRAMTLASELGTLSSELLPAGRAHVPLVGGASRNTAFTQACLTDRVIVNVASIVAGRGIRLFTPVELERLLQPLEMMRVREQIIELPDQVRERWVSGNEHSPTERNRL